MKERAIIMGAGSKGRHVIKELKEKYEVVCFVDNEKSIQKEFIDGVEIKSPEVLKTVEYDRIVLCNVTASITMDWIKQLEGYGCDKSKIVYDYCVYMMDARNEFVKSLAKIWGGTQKTGSVAEAGVWRGDFAAVINREFADRKCYLFDTFEGFTEKDIADEGIDEKCGRFSDTSVDLVMEKMSFPENVIIRKGRFPETAEGIDDHFCFVNLDMDLYLPTLEGLKFFGGKMVPGGVILVHDYFSTGFPGARKAVDEYAASNGRQIVPIGDALSMAVVF